MLNVVALVGRLVADPELRRTTTGRSVASFRIAVDRGFVKAGAERQADFIDIVAWEKSAEFVCKYFTKGSLIAVQGSIQTRSYEDKNGNKRTAVEVNARDISFVTPKSANGGSGYSANAAPNYEASAPVPAAPAFSQGSAEDFAVVDDNEDLPF